MSIQKPLNLLLMIKQSVYLFLTCILVFSCKKDKPEAVTSTIITSGNSGLVYISNEGNFQFGNAAISLYDKVSKNITEAYYKQVNQVPLGDVCQTMCYFNNKFYIVVNNSSKVVVVNAATFKIEATISGFNSPRYILPVSNSKAYVSDLYDNRLAIVNLSTNSISGYIPAVAGTEQLKMVYGKVFVSSLFTDKIYVINAMTDMLTDSIALAYSPNSICEDKNGLLWVMCSGDSLQQKPSALMQINPINNQVLKSFYFNGKHAPWRMNMSQQNDTLYFLDRHVWQMSISDTSLPSTPFINGNGKLFYSLAVDPNRNEIYVSDAIDYLQRGSIYRYSAAGNLIDQFKAGIIPGGFCFQ